MRDHLDGLHHHLRVASWLFGLCGLVSLALAAMGAHSLLSYRVAWQRKQTGLRMALGAARHTVDRIDPRGPLACPFRVCSIVASHESSIAAAVLG